jgi:hypothetical protein
METRVKQVRRAQAGLHEQRARLSKVEADVRRLEILYREKEALRGPRRSDFDSGQKA